MLAFRNEINQIVEISIARVRYKAVSLSLSNPASCTPFAQRDFPGNVEYNGIASHSTPCTERYEVKTKELQKKTKKEEHKS